METLLPLFKEYPVLSSIVLLSLSSYYLGKLIDTLAWFILNFIFIVIMAILPANKVKIFKSLFDTINKRRTDTKPPVFNFFAKTSSGKEGT